MHPPHFSPSSLDEIYYKSNLFPPPSYYCQPQCKTSTLLPLLLAVCNQIPLKIALSFSSTTAILLYRRSLTLDPHGLSVVAGGVGLVFLKV